MKCAPTKQDNELSKLKFNSKALFDDSQFTNKKLTMRLGEVQLGVSTQILE